MSKHPATFMSFSYFSEKSEMVDNRTSYSVGQFQIQSETFLLGLRLLRSPASPCDTALVILMFSQRHNAGAKRVEIMSIENIGLKASRAMVFNQVYYRIFIFNGVFFFFLILQYVYF